MRQGQTQIPPYAALLERLRDEEPRLVEEVVHDVALPDEAPEAVAALVQPVVVWTIETLAESETLPAERLALLHDEGSRAAIAGESLQRLLDRYLSTGWVVWGAATRRATDADAAAVAPLGTALLKAGDAAAAAIASGYGEAERALAVRAAGARREFMDELLDLAPGDSEAAARVRRRAAEFGLDPAAMYRLVVASLGHEIVDGSADLETLATLLQQADRLPPRRPGALPERSAAEPLTAARRGRVVVLVPTDGPLPAALEPAFEHLAGGPWLALAAPPAMGLARLAESYGAAIESLSVAARLGRTGLHDADEVLLERALLADEPLLAQAVGRELGPILGASRNARALLDTLDAFLASAENLTATARRLGIAPRTVAYRMARIQRLLGEPVRGQRAQRLATALLAARLLPPRALDEALANAAPNRQPRAAGPPGTPRAAGATATAARPRRAPRDRSRTRRTRGSAK
jgi:hypothetical protein